MPNIITDYQDNQSTYFRAKSRFNNRGLTSPYNLGYLGKYARSNGFHENSPFYTLDLRSMLRSALIARSFQARELIITRRFYMQVLKEATRKLRRKSRGKRLDGCAAGRYPWLEDKISPSAKIDAREEEEGEERSVEDTRGTILWGLAGNQRNTGAP